MREFFSDEIPLAQYKSACALKQEIRARILERTKMNWQLYNIETRGGLLALTYKLKER